MPNNWADFINQSMNWIQYSGWVGWVGFILLYVFTCVFFLPGSILTVGAGAVYGGFWGTVLVTVASTAGAGVNFLTSRYLIRNWVERKLTTRPKVRALNEAIGRDGWKLILLSRISPVIPHSLVSYSAGLTRISFSRYMLASFIGFLPLSAAYAFLGAVFGKFARANFGGVPHDPLSWVLTIASLVITVLVAWLSARMASKTLRKANLVKAEDSPA